MKQPWATQNSVLITGASAGIGKATAQLFAGKGFRVFGTSRYQRPDEDGVEMLQLDVRSDDSVYHAIGEVIRRMGRIDLLVNNAGVMHFGIAEETTMEDARAVFETNFLGTVRVTRAVLPHMRAARQGRIINVGSLAAWVGEPGEAFYCASKAALAGFTEALRHEVWPLGIHVSLVEPGAFRIAVLDRASVSTKRIADYDAVRRAAWRTLERGLGKGGDPQDVARLIWKIAATRSPRYRSGAGSMSHWLPYFRVLSPQSFFDRVLRRAYGIRKQEDSR